MRPKALPALALLAALSSCRNADVPLYDDLGSLHREVTTWSASAQRYFDQGLRLTYAFNHAEAVRAFRYAARLDPSCAMCWWGVALASGPNINWPMDSADAALAREASRRARSLAASGSDVEKALIEAMARRFAREATAARPPLDSAYALAMRGVLDAFPRDVDVLVLYADAMMNLSPWNYFSPDGTPRPGTDSLVAALERAQRAAPDHPGACHFWIHAMEVWHPDRALPCAERLASLMPGAGHLVHMPSHIYFRLGRFQEAIEHNRHGVHADSAFLERRGPEGVYPALYVPHNWHFLSAAAAMAGQCDLALEAGRLTVEAATWDRMRALPPLELFGPAYLVALVRCKRWDEIRRMAPPPTDLRYTTGMWRYARGIAYTATQFLDSAQIEHDELATIQAALPLAGYVGFNTSKVLLGIALDVLGGTIAARRGQWAEAIPRLQRAIGAQDSLTYDEPPAWYFPVRETLGAALLRTNRGWPAEAVFREDLRRNPGNPRSIVGLARALRAVGRSAMADSLVATLPRHWAGQGITLDPGDLP